MLGGHGGKKRANESSHRQEDANPVAASSSDESDNESLSAQPPPTPLSAKEFWRSHALGGAVSVWGVGKGSRDGDGNGARIIRGWAYV